MLRLRLSTTSFPLYKNVKFVKLILTTTQIYKKIQNETNRNVARIWPMVLGFELTINLKHLLNAFKMDARLYNILNPISNWKTQRNKRLKTCKQTIGLTYLNSYFKLQTLENVASEIIIHCAAEILFFYDARTVSRNI